VPFRYHGIGLGEALWGELDLVQSHHCTRCVKISGQFWRDDGNSLCERLWEGKTFEEEYGEGEAPLKGPRTSRLYTPTGLQAPVHGNRHAC